MQTNQTLVQSGPQNYQLDLKRNQNGNGLTSLPWIKKPTGTVFSRISAYNRLPFFRFSILSELDLLKIEWIFGVRSGEGKVFIHCICSLRNRSIVENVPTKELVLSGGKGRNLSYRLQLVVLNKNFWNLSHFVLAIIILEGNTTSAIRTIKSFKADVQVTINHVIIRSGSDFSNPIFQFWVQQNRIGEKVSLQVNKQHGIIVSTERYYSCKRFFRHGCVRNHVRIYSAKIFFIEKRLP